MKKLLMLSMVMIAINITALSQSENPDVLLSKSGKIILPEKGDFAVGITVNPMLNFIGNMFNGNQNNQFSIGLLNGTFLYGKYFLSASKAVRVKTFIHFSESVGVGTRINNLDAEINFGFEKRRGASRFQFLYGPELIIGANGFYQQIRPNDNRIVTSNKDFYIGARGFAGIEYFILPKLSLAAEMGLSVIGSLWGEEQSNSVNNDDPPTEKSFFRINTDYLNGQLMLMFHF